MTHVSPAHETFAPDHDGDPLIVLIIPDNRNEPVRLETITGNPALVLDQLTPAEARPLALESLEAMALVVRKSTMDVDDLDDQQPNVRASVLVWAAHRDPSGWREFCTQTAVVTGPLDADGRYTSVPADIIHLLTGDSHYQAQFRLAVAPDRWISTSAIFADWFDATLIGMRNAAMVSDVIEARTIMAPHPRLRDRWIRVASRRLNRVQALEASEIQGCVTVSELADAITRGPLVAGLALYYRDLFLMNQSDGTEDWFAFHDGISFALSALRPCINAGTFDDIIDLLMSSHEPPAADQS